MTALGLAVYEKRSACATALIDAGACLAMEPPKDRGGGDESSDDGTGPDAFEETTPLHEAIATGDALVVAAMVEAGHSLRVTDQARLGPP